jgi:hypothetical protein
MPVSVTRLDDLPVIIATLEGLMDLSMITKMYNDSAALMLPHEDRVYRLADVRHTDSTFADIMYIVKAASQGMPGSETDPRIRPVYVGNNRWIEMARNSLQLEQFGKVNVPMFHTIEDALLYVELDLDRKDEP